MDVKTYIKHERTHRTVLTETEIHDILVEAVAKKAGIAPYMDAASKVFISNRNHGSINSTEYQAEVTIVEDLAAQPTPAAREISDREWAAQPADMREGCTVRVPGVGEL